MCSDANAGGYCHRSATPQGPKNTVWFSDELTPRHDWTWAGGNLAFTASLRWHCSRVCSCWEDPHHDNMTSNMWQILENLSVMQHDESLFLLSRAVDGRGQKAPQQQQQILPAQLGPDPPSGSCGASGKEFCPLEWNYKAWGPTPDSPVGASDIVRPPPPPLNDNAQMNQSQVQGQAQTPSMSTQQQQQKANMSICGNECHQPSDCGTSDDQYSCSCAIPSYADTRKLGLDPVAPVAVCIALFASSMNAKAKAKSGSLNGRAMTRGGGGYTDSFLVPHTCVCDYASQRVSDECCVPNIRRRRRRNEPVTLSTKALRRRT